MNISVNLNDFKIKLKRKKTPEKLVESGNSMPEEKEDFHKDIESIVKELHGNVSVICEIEGSHSRN